MQEAHSKWDQVQLSEVSYAENELEILSILVFEYTIEYSIEYEYSSDYSNSLSNRMKTYSTSAVSTNFQSTGVSKTT